MELRALPDMASTDGDCCRFIPVVLLGLLFHFHILGGKVHWGTLGLHKWMADFLLLQVFPKASNFRYKNIFCSLYFISFVFSCSFKHSKGLEFQVQDHLSARILFLVLHLYTFPLHHKIMLPQILGLMAASVMGLVSAEDLLPCGNAFYVTSQVRLSLKSSFASKSTPNNEKFVVHVLRW